MAHLAWGIQVNLKKNQLIQIVAAVAAVIILAILGKLIFGYRPHQLPPVTLVPPIAYPGNPGEEEQFRAAVKAQEYILYSRIPNPEQAAASTVKQRPLIERACRGTDIPADIVSGLIFLESAGDPLNGSVKKAAGLGQFLPSVARNYGMRVDKPDKTAPLLLRARRGDKAALNKLILVDERFNPRKSVPATVHYLQDHKDRLGTLDIAVAAYHMGQGNLERVVRNFCAGNRKVPWQGSVKKTVQAGNLTWTKLVQEVSPGGHPQTYRSLTKLKDSSWTYWYRVNCAKQMLALYQKKPAQFRYKVNYFKHPQPKRRYELAEEPHWYGKYHRYEDWDDLRHAQEKGILVPVPLDMSQYGFRVDEKIGSPRVKDPAERQLLYMTRPCTVGLLGYLGTNLRYQARDQQAELRVTALVRSDEYNHLLTGKQGKQVFSTHSLGYAVDIAIPTTEKQKEGLEFLLTSLRRGGNVVWVQETVQKHYHVTLSPDGAERFRTVYKQMTK